MSFGESPLLLDGSRPLHWLCVGGAIGVITLLLQFLANRSLGISTGFENLCALVSRRPYFMRADARGPGSWRLVFMVGLVAGGLSSAALAGSTAPAWSLGPLAVSEGLGEAGLLGWMFAGGLLIGFGTRMAGGCTSGHGIFGLSNLEPASLVSTLAFMAAGVAATWLLQAL